MHALLVGSMVFTAGALAAVVAVRASILLGRVRQAAIEHRYVPILHRALAGDAEALQELASAPRRHHLAVASLLLDPLIDDRDPRRIAASRTIAQSMSLKDIGVRYLGSRLWWRRALALRAIGLLQSPNQTGVVVAALDDPHPVVRAAALDALADLRDPAAMTAIVVRLLDPSLERRRCSAALQAFGRDAEGFVLSLANLLPDYRVNYMRALALCGSAQARPELTRWASDGPADVRAGALAALARIGLDDACAPIAVEALDSDDPRVRASAARALSDWHGSVDVSEALARHLDDTWSVAVPAARALRSMGPTGIAQLSAHASDPGLTGLLARQSLWEDETGVS